MPIRWDSLGGLAIFLIGVFLGYWMGFGKRLWNKEVNKEQEALLVCEVSNILSQWNKGLIDWSEANVRLKDLGIMIEGDEQA